MLSFYRFTGWGMPGSKEFEGELLKERGIYLRNAESPDLEAFEFECLGPPDDYSDVKSRHEFLQKRTDLCNWLAHELPEGICNADIEELKADRIEHLVAVAKRCGMAESDARKLLRDLP